MQASTHARPSGRPQDRASSIQTTLYELVEAIGEEIGMGEERLIAKTVLHLLATGKVKFISPQRS